MHELDHVLEEISAYGGRSFDPQCLLQRAFFNVIMGLFFGKRFDDDRQIYANLMARSISLVHERGVSIISPICLSERAAFVMEKIFPKVKRLSLRQGVSCFVDFAWVPQGIDRFQTKRFKEDCEEILRIFKLEIAKAKQAVEDQVKDANFEPSNYVEAFYKIEMQENEKESNTLFTDDQLLATIMLIVSAGFLTTAVTVRAVLRYLAQYPKWQETVYDEIQKAGSTIAYADRFKLPLTEATIMETQRLTNVSLGTVKKTAVPSKLCGYDIPPGTMILPLKAAIMFDSNVYPDPTKFDPTRFLVSKDGEHSDRFTRNVPFGLGEYKKSGLR